MPPKKKGTKRKATPQLNGADTTNGDAPLAPPDRTTWPGWVEMESEPAFFNVMLKEMGVHGVKVSEVYGLEDEMLAILPQPVHALIFLFRYRDIDEAKQDKDTDCPDHVWFANQIPDFACASVALLNIVNNIKGLEMGKELRDFRTFTQEMDPFSRGNAIDDFKFVKNIHNSFARENDLLNADMHYKNKAAKAKKRQALAKARETREAKKDEKQPMREKPVKATATATRTSKRTPRKNVMTQDSDDSSPLSDPPESGSEFEAPSKTKEKPVEEMNGTRRSARQPKPRQDTFAASAAAEQDDEEGFHFIAYMPIQGHVWKLDGLDSFPQDMGPFDSSEGRDWMSIAQPALQTRMAMYEGAEIEFNLMAVVHDSIVKDRHQLLRNVKELQAIDKKLDKTFEDWRSLDGAGTGKDVILSSSAKLDISEPDIEATQLEDSIAETIEKEDDLLKLVEMRKNAVCQQAPLRGSIRDSMEASRGDDEKAKHRRHDYGKFVREWLGALGDHELLIPLVEAA